ncbi:MAG: antibiotic biosynthesis monooxygenase family protein [Dehalococcoidia bacterium]
MIEIMVERTAKEGKEGELLELIGELRGSALSQRGYISGETLVEYDDPTNFVIISRWGCPEHWSAWENSTQRKVIEDKMEPLMRDKPKIRVLKHPALDHIKGYYRTYP